jgi:hypothetical protein
MLKAAAVIGLLLTVLIDPICWAQETTTPPPATAEPAPPEASPKPTVKQESPASAEEQSKAKEQPKTETATPSTTPPSPAPPPAAPPAPPPSPAPPPAAPPAPPPSPTQQPAAEKEGGRPEVNKEAEKALAQPEETKPPVKVTEVERGGLLLAPGKFQLDLDFSYIHLSTNQIFLNGFSILPILVVGQINIERVRRDLFVTSFTVKYGLMQDFQLEVKIPYQVSLNRVSTAQGVQGNTIAQENVETVTQAADLGDVETTLYYQLWKERADRPAVIVGLAWKSKSGRDSFQTSDPTDKPPSGTGFTSLRGLISVVKTADPAILFGSFSYAYAFNRYNVVLHNLNKPETLIDLYPGDNFTFGLGLGYALNYRLSLSFQFLDSITFSSQLGQTDQSGAKVVRTVPNSFNNAGFFRMGASWTMSPTSSIELSVDQGLTGDAPDFTFEIKYPFKF